MATYGTIQFGVEPKNGMYPQPERRKDAPRSYTCEAVVATQAALDALYGAVCEVTYVRGLGLSQWTAYFDHGGDDATLTIPAAGQGAANGQQWVHNNAVLESVDGDGNAYVPDKFRVRLTFGLPELAG
jgi:hypothetical protein